MVLPHQVLLLLLLLLGVARFDCHFSRKVSEILSATLFVKQAFSFDDVLDLIDLDCVILI